MFKKTGFLICALCCFVLAGGHWTVLQTVAWANMIRVYSEDAPLGTALQMTFDGEHPCTMCVSIKEAKKQEKKNQQNAPDSAGKLLAVLCFFSTFKIPRRHLLGDFSFLQSFSTRTTCPPVPPPLPA